MLLIRKGYGYPGTGTHPGEFILHVNEAELWKNGDIVGPIDNFSVYGNIHDILGKGNLSSDEVEVSDPNFPGTVYSGWFVIPPSTVSLRS